MTEEQIKTLKKYERQILTAHRAKYYVGLAPEDIKSIYITYNELFPHQRETYTTCNACVLRVLDKLYKPLGEIVEEKKAEEPKAPKKGKGNGKKIDKQGKVD